MTDTPKPFDRAVQRRILEAAREAYPEAIEDPQAKAFGLGSLLELRRELTYLQEHDLLTFQHDEYSEYEGVRDIQITARGIDFLADDGGLGAILGVMTIKLHEDSLKALIEAKIQASDLPQPEKKRYLDQLRELPGETTKHLALKLVDLGLESLPAALRALQSLAGQG
ncbi:MAG TPA: hypothetical protein PKE36_00635 [Chiayiivirga sp.]|nr:hypothetical protein [Chiayiivirga sp.]